MDARSRDRKTIKDLLAEETQVVPDTSRLRGFTFTASPSESNIYTLFAMFEVPNSRKTVGVLWRGPEFATISAMSGWSHSADDDYNITVGGQDWTSNVLSLYKEMKFELEPHEYDRGIPGQFYACHAEKQLIAWFVDRHLLSVRTKRRDATGVETLEGMMEELSLRLRYEPPVSLKKAEIFVCRPVCQSCVVFAERVNSAFGLEIILRGF